MYTAAHLLTFTYFIIGREWENEKIGERESALTWVSMNEYEKTRRSVLWRCMSIWTGVANKAETGENQSSTSIEEQDEEEKGKTKK